MTEQEEKIETLERVIELMDECAELLRSLHDRASTAYCLADFEGRERGWAGRVREGQSSRSSSRPGAMAKTRTTRTAKRERPIRGGAPSAVFLVTADRPNKQS